MIHMESDGMNEKKLEKAIVVQVKDLLPDDACSIDPMFGLTEWSSLAAAHNNGSINIRDECWVGNVGDYYGAPKTTYACKLVPVDVLEPVLLESEKPIYAAAYAAALVQGTTKESLDSIAWETVMKVRGM